MNTNILVVDDTRDNLRLLSNILTKKGYQVRPVSNGSRALSSAQAKAPDLILLDIMMPDMDGYAVCKQLKADERTRDIPVIFISALNETLDKVKAFDLGGVDYITKPFQAEEILSRVKTHLSLRQMQQQLLAQNAQLQQANDQLACEITERKRVEEALREANMSKDLFFSILAHDLRSPFTALLGNAELALRYFDTLSREEIHKHLTHINTSAESVFALLENLLTWSRLERGIMESRPGIVPLFETVDHIVHLFLSNMQQKQITFQNDVPRGVSVYADANMIQTVIRNLFSNALKFTDTGGYINISAQQKGQEVEILISDTGVGIPEDNIHNLFRIDTRSSTRGTDGEQGTGLGLPLCKDLVEKNKGRLTIESTPGKGTTVRFVLPASTPNQELPSMIPDQELAELTRAIEALPRAWQVELHQIAETLNSTTANTLIDRIRQQDAALADVLEAFVNNYRFDLLQTLFRGD